MLPSAPRCNDHTRAIALRISFDAFNWCTEVDDIKSTGKVFGYRSVEKIDDQRATLRAQIDADLIVRQVHHDASLAGTSTTEIHISQAVFAVARFNLCEGLCSGCGSRCAGRSRTTQCHQNGVAFNLGVITQLARSLQNKARTITGLYDIDASDITFTDFVNGLAGTVSCAGEVKRDTWRIVNDKACGGCRRSAFEGDFNKRGSALLRRNVTRFEAVLGIWGRRCTDKTRRRQKWGNTSHELEKPNHFLPSCS